MKDIISALHEYAAMSLLREPSLLTVCLAR